MEREPKTLQEAILYFSDPDNCLNYIVARRWPDGVACPTCGSESVGFIKSRRVWQCKTRHPKSQFSVKIGTIFEDSPIKLDKWLAAIWMVANCKNGISSWEIHRALGVTQKTAWFMLHRIRLALQSGSLGKVGGEVEVDETFIGGKSRNMTNPSVRNGSTAPAARTKPLFWESWNAREKSEPPWSRAAKGKTSSPKSKRTLRQAPHSTLTPCFRTGGWTASTPIRSSTTPPPTSMDRSTPTAWKISGAC